MHVRHVVIKNFRAIENIECDVSPRINVIVGPNAVGKTTILQALRLSKGLLAPRSQTEPQQVLISLGAASPHFPQRLFLNTLCRDISLPAEIRSTYLLADNEIAALKSSIPELVQSVVAARIGQVFANPTALIQFLQSPQGQKAQEEVTVEVNKALVHIESKKTVLLGLVINARNGQLTHLDPLAGPIVGFIEQRLRPTLSYFSYFPADRALPMGETAMQLGAQDAQQQLESHNSQPQLKYQRLKTLIVNSLVVQQSDEIPIKQEFERIFSVLLQGRRIETINVNEIGLLSIMTTEISTGRLIEIDNLSSGEKNIALTFLLIAKSIAKGGIALFDEPELHLNPAVSRELLPFIMEEYTRDRNIQFIMCTHSPEILSGAFREPECKLLHLKSSTDITPVGKQSLEEYASALQRLGVSLGETLFYDGTIFVEGESDITFLETGFPELVKRFQLKERGGRKEIEKVVMELQELEQKGQKVNPVFLIFDHDDDVSKLRSTAAVRILQWPVRCVENYMIDIDVLAQILRDPTVTRRPIESAGAVRNICRELAFKQINGIASREAYNSFGYLNSSATRDDLAFDSIPEIAQSLFDRMASAKASLPEITKSEWLGKFTAAVQGRHRELELAWDDKWKEVCDGKKLINDVYRRCDIKIPQTAFIQRIVRVMKENNSDNWRSAKTNLEQLLAVENRAEI
jgi:predicted ATPase